MRRAADIPPRGPLAKPSRLWYTLGVEQYWQLAHGVAVRVVLPDDAAFVDLPVPAAAEVRADFTLRVSWLRAALDSEACDSARFWGKLRWTSSDTATLHLPSGRGQVVVDGEGATVLHVQLDRAQPERGFGSALRLCLALSLSARGGYLVHAAASAVDDSAVLLLGASGAGKTTSARRLGREGALRLADDLVVINAEQDRLWLEVCRFDRASGLRASTDRWPLATAYIVEKGAPCTQVGAFQGSALLTWTAALFMPAPQPPRAAAFLEALSELARSVPLRTLRAAPTGPLLPCLRADLAVLPPERT